MITFLNDKDDSQLRISFYENIVGVASFVGHECSPILLPLLQQVNHPLVTQIQYKGPKYKTVAFTANSGKTMMSYLSHLVIL